MKTTQATPAPVPAAGLMFGKPTDSSRTLQEETPTSDLARPKPGGGGVRRKTKKKEKEDGKTKL